MFRTPYANNIDLDSALPISIFANSVGTLHEIDAAHSEYLAEFRKMRAKIIADETVLSGKDGITDDYFVKIEGDGKSTMEQQIIHIVGVSMRGEDGKLVTKRYSYSYESGGDPTSDVTVELETNPRLNGCTTPLEDILY